MSPKCPYCNEELDYVECCRTQNEGDYYYEKWEGYCPKCNRSFFWDEIYTFAYYDNLEEVKELE